MRPQLHPVLRHAFAVTLVALLQGAPARGAADDQAPRAIDAAPPEAPAEATKPDAPADILPPSGAPAAPPAGAKRIIYLPEGVKAQLKEEIKQEVLAEAKRDGWAAPNAVPAWMTRLRLSGDLRARFERDLFGHGNAVGQFPDFNGINNNGPWNFNDVSTDRFLNVDTPRTRPRLRARLGVDADVGQGFTSEVRLGTGDSNAPVSSNQTLGSPGFFSKYQFWLDRAFLRYGLAQDALTFEVGRFGNPFFATELVWADVVNFDGLAMTGRTRLAEGFGAFIAAGVFPLYTTAFNFPSYSPDKFGSFNKWLYAAQLGADFNPTEGMGLKLGAAFYYFSNVEGQIGAPCDTSLKYITCNTDDSRPPSAQKGNTYMYLRTPNESALAAEASSGGTARYQYFGLAARFRDLVLTGRLDLRVAPPVKVSFEGEFVRNVGLSKKQVTPVALNNCADQSNGPCTQYVGGGDGYLGRVTFGSPTQEKQWDWNVGIAYRYLESDATVDAFVDPDFGLGGTNLKGFVLGGAIAVADNVWTAARWMSADQVFGPPYRSDVLQIDMSTRF
jgi:putative porin